MERLLDKKQIWVILFEFKTGHKEAEVTCNINSVFGPGTATKYTVEWWFKKFCKGDKRLEDEEDSGWPLEVDGDQLRGSLRLILLQLHEKLPKDSILTILRSFSIWSKSERWKILLSGCLASWPKIKKASFWNVIFYSMRQQQTISLLDCEVQWKVDFIQQLAMFSSGVVLRRGPRALPKARLAPKKTSWSPFDGLLPVWSTTASWILAKSLHLRSMLWQLMRCPQNCNACSQHWSTERAQFFF